MILPAAVEPLAWRPLCVAVKDSKVEISLSIWQHQSFNMDFEKRGKTYAISNLKLKMYNDQHQLSTTRATWFKEIAKMQGELTELTCYRTVLKGIFL